MAGISDKRRVWIRRLAILGIAGSLTVTAASILSFAGFNPAYVGGTKMLVLLGGCVWIEDAPTNAPTGFRMVDTFVTNSGFVAQLRDWFDLPWRFKSGPISIPLGLPTAILATVSVTAFWTTRRRMSTRHCKHCGYDLTGNVSGVCPECGAAISEAELRKIAGSRSEQT